MKKVLLILLVLLLLAGGAYYFFKEDIDMYVEDMTTQEDTTPEEDNTQQEETSMLNEDLDTEEEDKVFEYMNISVEDAKDLIESNENLVILDVSNRYDEGHIPNAINYYVGDGSLDAAIPTLDPDDTYLVYCHVDSASILGSEKLIDAGFKYVYRLEGNYSAWVDAGYDVEM